MTKHEHYEVLCALAATGQLAGPEKADFDDHRIQCRSCSGQLQDLLSIGARVQFDAAISAKSAPMPPGSFERFRARALHEGIALHSVPVRASSWYALASVAVVFVIAAVLVIMPGMRNAPEHVEMSAAASIPLRQGSPASVRTRGLALQSSRAIHAHVVRHRRVPHTGVGMIEADGAAQHFPRVLTANYSFFGPENPSKSSTSGYPALSRSQISQFALFSEVGDGSATNVASLGNPSHRVDVASIGKVFDFSITAHQAHFQLPTAQ